MEMGWGWGGRQDWLGITWVRVWGGDRPFLAWVNGDSLIGELPSFSLNTFKSLSASRLTHKKDAILLKL